MRQRVCLAVALLAVTATTARSQLPPVGVPRGALRVQLGGEFNNFDQRYLNGVTQSYAKDFSQQALGSTFWPALAPTDTILGQIIGQSGYALDLGRTNASEEVTIGVASIDLALGVTKGLTVFATVPLTRVRVQPIVTLDSAYGAAGFNPNDPVFGSSTGRTQAATFFSEFDAALTTLNSNIQGGLYNSNPTLLAIAQSTLTSGTQLRNQLYTVTASPATASPFLPTLTSGAGNAITTRVTGIQDTLTNTLGVPGFSQPAVLADSRLDQTGYDTFVSNPFGPIAGQPIQDSTLWALGDMSFGASYTWIDHWDQGEKRGGIRSAARATITIPTGQRDRADNFFDLGTGQARNDLILDLITDLGIGRWGARVTGGYTYRFPTTRPRRVTPPSQPIPYANRLTNVEIDAGNGFAVGVQPFFRLARLLALQAVGGYSYHAADQVTYSSTADSLPGVSAGQLAVQTQTSAFTVGGGISYSSVDAPCPAGKCPLPLDASWTYETVVSASGGRVPKAGIMRMQLRFYFQLFGKGGG